MYKTELKIDIDEKPRQLKKYSELLSERLFIITKIYNFRLWLQSIKVYETIKGFHLYVKLISDKKVEDFEILQMQSSLKDDYIRGLFNMVRVKGGEQPRDYWNLLFKSKESKTKKSILFERSFFINYYFVANAYEEEYNHFFESQYRVKQEINGVINVV